MAWEGTHEDNLIFSLIADDDFRETSGFGAFLFVTGAAEKHFTLAVGAGSSGVIGVVITDPRANAHGSVVGAGITKVICGSSFGAYVDVTCSASGRAIPVGSGDIILGMALTAAAPDEFATIVVRRQVVNPI